MNVSNLGVCFGPTLLRPEEETVASILDLKFYNIVVEILIDNYQRIFFTEPEKVSPKPIITSNAKNSNTSHGTYGSPVSPHNNVQNYLPSEEGVSRIYANNGQGVRIASNYRGYSQPYTCVSNFWWDIFINVNRILFKSNCLPNYSLRQNNYTIILKIGVLIVNIFYSS